MFDITAQLKAIRDFYGDQTAERSGAPLINHIHEGVRIIQALDGELPNGRAFDVGSAARAFCLHPLFQNDAQLTSVGLALLERQDVGPYATASPVDVLLVMEYRARANAWLSTKVWLVGEHVHLTGLPDAGPLGEVAAMLIADKVQNYKDFERYHVDTHSRRVELEAYFQCWLRALGVNERLYESLALAATKESAHV